VKCISATSLSKTYGDTRAVDGIDLSVEPGQSFGFLGANGAGKSTTIKMLTTLIRPTGGSLNILGVDALKDPLQVRRHIGVVLQQPSYEPTLSVEKSLTKYGMMWGVPGDESRRRAERLMRDFGLADLRRKRNEDLSIGQRRRVQVAREFMHDMDLLFLDEPTVGLDPAARRELLDYLKERAAAGLTIFYTTHVLSEADYLCDNIAIIQKGSILASGTPAALKKRLGRKKTITLRTNADDRTVSVALAGIPDCSVQVGMGAGITIESARPEHILMEVMGRLHKNDIKMRDISAEAATLEDIFLETIRDASNTETD
jgi:ABC-2 type transport system ATP-binding protein